MPKREVEVDVLIEGNYVHLALSCHGLRSLSLVLRALVLAALEGVHLAWPHLARLLLPHEDSRLCGFLLPYHSIPKPRDLLPSRPLKHEPGRLLELPLRRLHRAVLDRRDDARLLEARILLGALIDIQIKYDCVIFLRVYQVLLAPSFLGAGGRGVGRGRLPRQFRDLHDVRGYDLLGLARLQEIGSHELVCIEDALYVTPITHLPLQRLVPWRSTPSLMVRIRRTNIDRPSVTRDRLLRIELLTPALTLALPPPPRQLPYLDHVIDFHIWVHGIEVLLALATALRIEFAIGLSSQRLRIGNYHIIFIHCNKQ